MEIIDNFLQQDDFDTIASTIMSKGFPWYHQDGVAYKDEVKDDIYRHAKFNLLVKDNYITNQESLQFEAQKEKQIKIKKAKKGKISVQSLDKLEALQKLDKLMLS